MAWVLTTGLKTWREAELNAVFPNRDRASDGSVGDLAHQGGSSGHNPDRTGRAEYRDGDSKDEVRAIDVDKDLRHPRVTMEMVVQWVVGLARSGVWVPFEYIIFNGRIWSSSDGWQTRIYRGSNSHSEHAHFSGGFSQRDDEWTGKLGLAAFVAATIGKTTPPRKVATMKFDVEVPVLKEGDDDSKLPGYDTIWRMQRVVGAKSDGNWGPLTTEALRKFMGYKTAAQAKTMTEEIYRKVFALPHVKK